MLIGNQDNYFPYISALIVVRNESDYIKKSIESFISQNYPKDRFEIIIVDGDSTDNTLEIINKTISENNCFNAIIINNPNKTLASGWNLGIKHSAGEYIVRIDAHSIVENDFFTKCIKTHQEVEDAICVGGSLITETSSQKYKEISFVLSSPFGVGNSKFRYSSQAGYVDTVAFGMYKKHIFDIVGYFDESLKRNQDIDLHSRIRKAGYKFYLDPSITIKYFSRRTVKAMMKQGFNNGKWNFILFKKNRSALSIRHVIPFAFVSCILLLIVLGIINNIFLELLAALLLLYLIIGLFFSIKKTRNIYSILIMPFLFFLLHISYGFGSLVGIFKKR